MAEINFLMSLLYGHGNPVEGMDERGPIEVAKAVPFDDGHADVPDFVTRLFEKAERGELAKTASVADGSLAYESWDEPLEKLELSPAFMERSAARLKKTFAVIDRIFADHENECAAAKAIACQLLIDTRNDVAKILTA
jgi:hypothetical protein